MDRIVSYLKARKWTLLGVALIVIGFKLNPAMAAVLGGVSMIGLVNVNDDIIKLLIKQNLLDAAGGIKLDVVAKTGNYMIVTGTDPSGRIFTNRGAAGVITITLPAVTQALSGVFYRVMGHADQNIVVATAVADTMVVTNDVAADSLASSTASVKIGTVMEFVCDGTQWFGYGINVGVGGTANTYTVAS